MDSLYSKRIPYIFLISFCKTMGYCIKLCDLNRGEIDFSFNDSSLPSFKNDFQFNSKPIPYPTYLQSFQKVQDFIQQGDTYLCNLTFETEIQTTLDLKTIYDYCLAKYKFFSKDQFVFFSPERFVHIRDNIISTNPMKGTITAELPNNSDILLKDPKENSEHNTIVDLLRNDLSIVATQVRLANFKYLDKIKTHKGSIWQMSSEISGTVRPEYRQTPAKIFDSLLPAGSICGAPKNRTVEIIHQVENYHRGYYSGVIGVYDGTEIDSAVMIRYIEKKGDKLVFKSGGGITYMSDPIKEYQELNNKIYVPFL
ncbi:MAG: aminodeoxychorismate synthase component I [Bacteroidota bacterium]|nr:aminodeoxychorismate synthase component I [Bacteroidota bacterium]